MPPFDLLLPFFVATAIFACVPGPGMLYAAAQTVARGGRAGLLAAVGFHLGGYVHIAAAAFGLAALLHAVPTLFAIVKLAGAAYLVWLGLRLFASAGPMPRQLARGEPATDRRAVRDSIAVELLNPKTALFYLAFLPQFTDPSAALPIWAQILVLGGIVNVMFSLTDVLCILLSERTRRLLIRSRAASRLGRQVAGGILVALGVNLAASRQ